MDKRRYVLVWSIWTENGHARGAFCPSGGLGLQEGHDAMARLYARAGAENISLPSSSYTSGRTISADLVPYVFDVVTDRIDGLEWPSLSA